MKKVIFAWALMFGLLISLAKVEAADYYLGVYEDGAEAYLDTESIIFEFKFGRQKQKNMVIYTVTDL